MSEIVSMVSNIGFPIAMCILLIVQNSKQMKELTDAVNNNTLTMQKLLERMDDRG